MPVRRSLPPRPVEAICTPELPPRELPAFENLVGRVTGRPCNSGQSLLSTYYVQGAVLAALRGDPVIIPKRKRRHREGKPPAKTLANRGLRPGRSGPRAIRSEESLRRVSARGGRGGPEPRRALGGRGLRRFRLLPCSAQRPQEAPQVLTRWRRSPTGLRRARAPLHRPLRELEVTTATRAGRQVADRGPGARCRLRARCQRPAGSPAGWRPSSGPVWRSNPRCSRKGHDQSPFVQGGTVFKTLSPAQFRQKARGYCVPSRRLTLSASSPNEGGRRTPLYRQGG